MIFSTRRLIEKKPNATRRPVHRRPVLVGLCTLLYFLAACSPAPPAAPPPRQTDIQAGPQFAAFYAAHGGPRVFGYPITEPFEDPATGRTVQYFQTMRLEHDPARPDAQAVLVADLGRWAFAGVTVAVAPVPPSPNGRQRAFPDAGLVVQDEFLTFYETYHGETLFGPPISPQFDEGGKQVQYFRNGRLEWDPNLPAALRIQVSALGRAHFEQSGALLAYINQGGYRPRPSAGLQEALVSADVRAPVVYRDDREQIVYVAVRDPDGRAVAEIAVGLRLTYLDRSQTFDLGRTDGEGRLQGRFDVSALPPGQEIRLEILVYGDAGQIIGRASLTFKTWW